MTFPKRTSTFQGRYFLLVSPVICGIFPPPVPAGPWGPGRGPRPASWGVMSGKLCQRQPLNPGPGPNLHGQSGWANETRLSGAGHYARDPRRLRQHFANRQPTLSEEDVHLTSTSTFFSVPQNLISQGDWVLSCLKPSQMIRLYCYSAPIMSSFSHLAGTLSRKPLTLTSETCR